MKNTLKLGALALALAVSFASCSGNKSTSAADSAKVADSTKKDSLKNPPPPPPDTSVKPKGDTTKKK